MKNKPRKQRAHCRNIKAKRNRHISRKPIKPSKLSADHVFHKPIVILEGEIQY